MVKTFRSNSAQLRRYSEFFSTSGVRGGGATWYERAFPDGFEPRLLFLVHSNERRERVRRAVTGEHESTGVRQTPESEGVPRRAAGGAMVKFRPYVVAVNHVPECPRLESGQGGPKQGRRRCAPGCQRTTDGWEVDLALRLPDGTRIRERVKAPVAAKSAAFRWAQEREAVILAQHGRQPKKTETKKAPTLSEFKPRFIEGHVKANRLKPSSAEAYESMFRNHLLPTFGELRLDKIGDELVQRFKGELVEDEMANKSINNLLTALSVTLKRAVDWKVIDAMPCRIRLLKWERAEVPFYDFADYRRLVEGAAQSIPVSSCSCSSPATPAHAEVRPSPWSGATWTCADGRSTRSAVRGMAK